MGDVGILSVDFYVPNKAKQYRGYIGKRSRENYIAQELGNGIKGGNITREQPPSKIVT